MDVKHLSDAEIQDYLDGLLTAKPTDSASCVHLESCRQCQKQLEQYRSLYGHLQTTEPVGLAADFAGKVMANLPAAESRASVRKWQKYRLAAAIFAGPAILGLLVLIFDLSVLAAASRVLAHTIKTGRAFWVILADAFSMLDINPVLFGYTALVILAISTLDHLISRARERLRSA